MATPAWTIVVDGVDSTARINPYLISLDVIDKAGAKDDRMTLVVDDRDQVLEMPRKGAKVTVSIGYAETGVQKLGAYVVNDIDVGGPVRTMTIRASGTDQASPIKAPKEKSWHDTTIGEIAKKIAAENGLKAQVDPEYGQIKIEHEDQTESDTEFLSRLCVGIGCIFKVNDGKLIIAGTNSGKSAGGKSMPTIEVKESDCSDWNATITQKGKYGSAKARWHDPKKGEVLYEKDGSGKPELVLSRTYPTKEAAKKAAESALKASLSSTGRFSISGLKGNPSLSAECKIKPVGFRKGVDELNWYVETVRHSITESGGYICNIEADTKK